MKKIDRPELLDLLKDKLKRMGIPIVRTDVIHSEKDYFRSFHYDQHDRLNISTLILDNEKSKRDWYKSGHFDESMDDGDKTQIEIDEPINKEIKEYFDQKITLLGETWYLRIS